MHPKDDNIRFIVSLACENTNGISSESGDNVVDMIMRTVQYILVSGRAEI